MLLFSARCYNRRHRPNYTKIANLEKEVFGEIYTRNDSIDPCKLCPPKEKKKHNRVPIGYGYNGPLPSSLARANFPKRVEPEIIETYPESRFGDPSDTSGITSEDW